MKKKNATKVLLVAGIFYFSFMVLDRALSVIYGFNFQPYGQYAPKGFPIWGHLGNGSIAAFCLYIVFRIYDYGTEKGILYLRILPFVIFAVIGALIPYFADSQHLAKHDMGHTLPLYLLVNDLYVFLIGLITYKLAKPAIAKLAFLAVMAVAFLYLHFLVYVPMFPDFYWL